MDEFSETATAVGIVMTADKGIFPHRGYLYLPGSAIETNELFYIVDLAKTSSSIDKNRRFQQITILQ